MQQLLIPASIALIGVQAFGLCWAGNPRVSGAVSDLTVAAVGAVPRATAVVLKVSGIWRGGRK